MLVAGLWPLPHLLHKACSWVLLGGPRFLETSEAAGTNCVGLTTARPDSVILGSSVMLSLSSESESSPSPDIGAESDPELSLSSLVLFRFWPVLEPLFLPFPVPDAPLFCRADAGLRDTAKAPVLWPVTGPELPLPPVDLLPLLVDGLGISIFIDVFMPISTLRLISSYPGGVPVIPKEEKLVDPTPELMRLRIISVAALNCGTYLGGDFVMVASTVVVAMDTFELEAWGASMLRRGTYRSRGGRRGVRRQDLGTLIELNLSRSTCSSSSAFATYKRLLSEAN